MWQAVKGDLTKRLDTNIDQEFSDLAKGFNTFTENLQNRIIQSVIGVEIKRGTEITVKGGCERISKRDEYATSKS